MVNLVLGDHLTLVASCQVLEASQSGVAVLVLLPCLVLVASFLVVVPYQVQA